MGGMVDDNIFSCIRYLCPLAMWRAMMSNRGGKTSRPWEPQRYPQGYAPPADSAGAPRDERFSHRDCSSSLSTWPGDRGIVCRKKYYRLPSLPWQLCTDKSNGLFRGQPPRMTVA